MATTRSGGKVVEVVTSGVPSLYMDVEIYDTVLEKIEANHPVEYAHLDDVKATIRDPHRVHRSKTRPETSVVLLNTDVTSTGGDPLRVVVKNVASNGTSLMATAHFSSSQDQGELLYERENRNES